MYVCICKQVTERQIKEAVSNGACSLRDVQSQLGVATQCGECKHHARQCIRSTNRDCGETIFTANIQSTDLIATI